MNYLRILMVLCLGAFIFMAAPSLWAQSEPAGTQAYVVQPGDSLSSIAKKFYGQSNLGAKLWKANHNLVSHPQRLTAGDILYIFPQNTLELNQAVSVPPPPQGSPAAGLYDRGRLLNTAFPKYFSFVADLNALGGSGASRAKVRRVDPATGAAVDQLYEIRLVGEILASPDMPNLVGDDLPKASAPGKMFLSVNDTVVVRFIEDLAKILDSDSYQDSDPYFREYPIYSTGKPVQEPNLNRADRRVTVGNLYRYLGKLTVVSRVEGLAPSSGRVSNLLKGGRTGRGNDVEPVSYLAKITYAEDAIEPGDAVFIFVPLEPGPERMIEAPFVEPAGSYNSLGN